MKKVLEQVDVLVKFADGQQLLLLAQPVVGISDTPPKSLDPDDLDPHTPRASPDFSAVWWNGRLWTLSKNQRAIVRYLWQAWLDGVDYVGGDFLLEVAGVASKTMYQVWRGSDAWEALIINGARTGGSADTYRLAPLL